mmetsp:Transcript_2938/g.11905  ORF Transcript_2938/g.11905 Transcript_2938/m.11905 type:complete len:204 (-) Transcript_2938:640-1251(-)|eukprot:scaffold2113_cov233-Pinguiococcus_pyrenoidosus.AAC.25
MRVHAVGREARAEPPRRQVREARAVWRRNGQEVVRPHVPAVAERQDSVHRGVEPVREGVTFLQRHPKVLLGERQADAFLAELRLRFVQHRPHRGDTWLLIEQRHLAEVVPRIEPRQHGLLALVHDLGAATDDDEELVPDVALANDLLPHRERLPLQLGGDREPLLGRQVLEQRHVFHDELLAPGLPVGEGLRAHPQQVDASGL